MRRTKVPDTSTQAQRQLPCLRSVYGDVRTFTHHVTCIMWPSTPTSAGVSLSLQLSVCVSHQSSGSCKQSALCFCAAATSHMTRAVPSSSSPPQKSILPILAACVRESLTIDWIMSAWYWLWMLPCCQLYTPSVSVCVCMCVFLRYWHTLAITLTMTFFFSDPVSKYTQ